MRRRSLFGRVVALTSAVGLLGMRGAERLGYTIEQGANGLWFANVRGSLFLIRPDGIIGSDSIAARGFKELVGR